MAPGVAKSFKKIYKENIIKFLEANDLILANEDFNKKYLYTEDFYPVLNIDKYNKFAISEFEQLKNLFSCTTNVDEDLDNKIKTSQELAYKFSVREVTKKTYQAMEGLIHNLNTMNCLPYSEVIWVYDTKKEDLLHIEIGEFEKIFEENRFKAISLNQTTGESEMKFITHVIKKDNNRRLIKITDNEGRQVTTTDNHKIMYLSEDGKISEANPEELPHVLSPRGINTPASKFCISLDHYHSRTKQNYLEDHVMVTEEFAKIAGYYVADGSITGGSVLAFSTCDEECEQELIELMKKVYNEEVTYKFYKRENGKAKDIRFNVGKVFSDMIKDKFGQGAHNKKIPVEILFSTDDIKRQFLNGYFKCDGYTNRNYVIATSVSKKLRDSLNLMLLSMKELPHVAKRISNSYKYCESYEVSLNANSEVRLKLEFNKRKTDIELKNYNYEFLKSALKKQDVNIKNKITPQKLETYFDNELAAKALNLFPVTINKFEELNSGEEYVYDISVADNETFLTAEGIYVHNSRAGAQCPFSSLNFGTDTSEEGRLVIEQFLLATEAGLGNGETPIFPISIFKIKEGISFNPDDPNYDLFKLAIRCSAKRLFPNFSFLDSPFNLQYYDPNRPETEIGYMG